VASKCKVIPFGIDLRRVAPTEQTPREAAEIRARFGDQLILSVGRLVYYKGFDHLIRAMRSVPGKLLIIGEGPLEAALAAQIQREGLSEFS
jgi:rhamnosyl/mannosyltransferase